MAAPIVSVVQVKFTVRGKTIDDIAIAARETLSAFMHDEPIDKWRVVMEVHEHAEDNEWVGHATVRPRRRRDDDDFDF